MACPVILLAHKAVIKLNIFSLAFASSLTNEYHAYSKPSTLSFSSNLSFDKIISSVLSIADMIFSSICCSLTSISFLLQNSLNSLINSFHNFSKSDFSNLCFNKTSLLGKYAPLSSIIAPLLIPIPKTCRTNPSGNST